MISGSGGLESRRAKAAGAGQLARWEMKHCRLLWQEANYFQVKSLKNWFLQSTFKSSDVQKMHAIDSRSTNASCLDRLWKLSCRKSVRRCGAKHISKSTCTKQFSSGALLKVEVSKCTPLWPEAHFREIMRKPPHVWTSFGSSDVGKVHVVVVRSTFWSQTCENMMVFSLFWGVR